MERDTGEYIIDPWVVARHTIVGIERDRLVAAAHLKRYATGSPVGASYDDAGSIDWIICWPDQLATGRLVLGEALDQLGQWAVRIWHADGALPCLGVYGIPDSWPHVVSLVVEAGFDDADGQSELIFAGEVAAVELPGLPPMDGLTVRRVLGTLGISFEAVAGDEVVGVFEVEDGYTRGGSVMSLEGWADEGNHWVREDLRSQGIGSWLFSHGCAWLRSAAPVDSWPTPPRTRTSRGSSTTSPAMAWVASAALDEAGSGCPTERCGAVRPERQRSRRPAGSKARLRGLSEDWRADPHATRTCRSPGPDWPRPCGTYTVCRFT